MVLSQLLSKLLFGSNRATFGCSAAGCTREVAQSQLASLQTRRHHCICFKEPGAAAGATLPLAFGSGARSLAGVDLHS